VAEGAVIRRFTDSAIQSSIDRALSTLPAGQGGAVIAYADTKGARLATFAKLGGGWSLVGVLEKPYRGPLLAEAAVRFTW
jgi:hypothetical protein